MLGARRATSQPRTNAGVDGIGQNHPIPGAVVACIGLDDHGWLVDHQPDSSPSSALFVRRGEESEMKSAGGSDSPGSIGRSLLAFNLLTKQIERFSLGRTAGFSDERLQRLKLLADLRQRQNSDPRDQDGGLDDGMFGSVDPNEFPDMPLFEDIADEAGAWTLLRELTDAELKISATIDQSFSVDLLGRLHRRVGDA